MPLLLPTKVLPSLELQLCRNHAMLKLLFRAFEIDSFQRIISSFRTVYYMTYFSYYICGLFCINFDMYHLCIYYFGFKLKSIFSFTFFFDIDLYWGPWHIPNWHVVNVDEHKRSYPFWDMNPDTTAGRRIFCLVV